MSPRRRRPDRSGSAIVEMAVVMPLFIALVLGQIETARLGMVAQLLTTAAREGCRTAVLHKTTSSSAILTRINAVLTGSGLSFSTLSTGASGTSTTGAFISPSTWSSSKAGTAITITLRVNYEDVSWLPSPYFLHNAKVTGSATLSSERP